MGGNKTDLWLKNTKKNVVEGRTTNYWIKVRRTKKYFDVLIGKKGEKAHIHYGLKPDYSYLFLEDRGKVKRVTREIINKNQEKELVDERIFNEQGEPQLIVKSRFNSRIKEGQIYTFLEGITLSERKILFKK